MVSHLVSSFLQLPFLDGPDPSLDETLYVFSKSSSVAPSAASPFLYPQSAHAPCTALFIADNGVTLVLLPCRRHVLRPCHVPLQFQGLDSSGERFISLPDNADRTLQITASVLLCGFMRLNFRFWDSTPHNKRVYFQSAQCRRGAFPPSERSHSWARHVAIHE